MAKQAKIDAFVLNIAHGEAPNSAQLINAFGAANSKGFKLFLSFDYAGGDGWQTGGWSKDDVRALLRQYANNGAYYKRGSQPLVSTFEGPSHAADWASIKSEFGIFFIPDWSSLGAKKALEAAPSGVLDGLFNWAAWPWGTGKMDTYTDASYLNYLGGESYSWPFHSHHPLPSLLSTSPSFEVWATAMRTRASGAASPVPRGNALR